MAENNSTTSMLNSRTLVGLILKEFLNQIEAWSPDLAYVYDEPLTYDTAVAKYRADKQLTSQDSIPLPLLAFRRSVLKPDAENSIGKRSINKTFKCTLADGSVDKYKGLVGTFDIEFLYITRSMEDLERFEISYILERSVSHIKNIEVNIPELQDPIPYSLRYGELDDKIINSDNTYYKALSATFSVHGVFLMFESGGNGVIKEINQKTSDYDQETCTPTVELDSITITPEV